MLKSMILSVCAARGERRTGLPGQRARGGPGLAGLLWALGPILLLPAARGAAQQLTPLYVLNTVEGSGASTSPFGDGGPALEATSGNISDVVVDSHGNIYFVDDQNCVIRRVDSASGDISTVAGVAGSCGFAGDGGPAEKAEIYPWGLALDNAGNLLIADRTNEAIRRLDMKSGLLTTIAGQLGLSGFSGDGEAAANARIDTPWGVSVDKLGNIIIADYSNQRVRMIDHATGNISTIAGTGEKGNTGIPGAAAAAEMNNPARTYTDAAGQMLIADHAGSAILELTPDGDVKDVAGVLGTSGATLDPGGVATLSETDTPLNAVDDMKGNIIFADEANQVVRLVNPAGMISTIGGVMGKKATRATDGVVANSVAEFNNPYALTIDWNDDIYVTDTYTFQVTKLSHMTRQPATAVGAASAPQSIILSAAADLTPQTAAITPSSPPEFALGTLANCSLGTLLAANTPCTAPVTFTPAYPGMRAAQLAITDSTGNVSLIGLSGVGTAPEAWLSQATISTIIGDGTAGSGAGEVNAPRGGAADPAGDIYVADTGNNVIRRITPAGVASIVAGTGAPGYSGDGGAATAATLKAPSRVALDYAGNLYIADTGNNVIRLVSAATGAISTIAGNGTAGYSGDGGAPASAELNAPQGLALDPGGRVYVADTGNNVIRYFGPGGLIGTIAGTGVAGYAGDGSPAADASLSSPASVAVDLYGDIYIADTGNDVVRLVTSATNNLSTFGIISTLAGVEGESTNAGDGEAAHEATLAAPSDVAVDAAGDVYIAAGDRVRVVDASGIISTVAGADGTTGYSGEGGAAGNAVIPAPAGGIALDGAANLYIFATAANRVLEVAADNPAALDLGQAVPGSNGAAETVTLRDTGNSPLTIGTVAVSPGFTLGAGESSACVAGATVPPGGSCSLSVAFSPAALGTAAGTLTVTDNSLNGTGVTHTIALTGRGVNLNATATSLSLSPAMPVYGMPSTLTATLSGGLSPTGTITFSVNGSSIGSAGLSAAGQASIPLPALPAGPVTIEAAYPGDSSNGSSSATVNANIQPAVLTVTAGNATLPWGSTALPQFTYTISGFVNGDTASVITGTPQETTAATLTSAPGTYPITLTAGTLSAANYTFTFVDGTLTVQSAPLPDFTLTLTPAAMTVFTGSGKPQAVTLTLTPLYGYKGSVSLSCSGLPQGAACEFTGALSGDGLGDPAWTQVKIYASQGSGTESRNDPRFLGSRGISMCIGLPLLFGFALCRRRSGIRAGRLLGLSLLALVAGGATSCSSGGKGAAAGTYQVVITAADASSNLSHSATLALTIQ